MEIGVAAPLDEATRPAVPARPIGGVRRMRTAGRPRGRVRASSCRRRRGRREDRVRRRAGDHRRGSPSRPRRDRGSGDATSGRSGGLGLLAGRTALRRAASAASVPASASLAAGSPWPPQQRGGLGRVVRRFGRRRSPRRRRRRLPRPALRGRLRFGASAVASARRPVACRRRGRRRLRAFARVRRFGAGSAPAATVDGSTSPARSARSRRRARRRPAALGDWASWARRMRLELRRDLAPRLARTRRRPVGPRSGGGRSCRAVDPRPSGPLVAALRRAGGPAADVRIAVDAAASAARP